MGYKPSRNVFLLGIISLFNDLSSEMILSIFPAFFTSVLKAGASSLGIVDGIAEGASNFIKIYSGKLSDKIKSRKPFIFWGYTLSVITRPIYILVTNVWGALGLRFTDRIGKGLRDSPRDAIISLSSKEEEVGRAFGFHRAFDTIGAIIGPLVAYLILSKYPGGFNKVFITSFVIGLIAIGTTFFVKDIVGEIKKKNLSLSGFSGFSKDFKTYLFSLFFLSLGTVPITVLLLKTQNFGLTLASIPLFYMVYNISYASFSFYAGKLSDKFGVKNLILIGYMILIASYIFLYFAENQYVLIAGFFIMGFFPAITDGMQRAFASKLSLEEHRGSALGYVNAISGFGLLFAGIIGGYLWQYLGPGYALIIGGIIIILGILILSLIKADKIRV